MLLVALLLLAAAAAWWGARHARGAADYFAAGHRAGAWLVGVAGTAAALSAFTFVGGPGLFSVVGTGALWIILSAPLTGALQCWAVGETDAAITLTVDEVKAAPVLAGVPPTATVAELAPYTFTATAPDRDLPVPDDPDPVTGLTAAEELYQLADGTWASRVRVDWTASTSPYVSHYVVTLAQGSDVFRSEVVDRNLATYASPPVQEDVLVQVDVQVVSVTGAIWWRAQKSNIFATVAGEPSGEPEIDLRPPIRENAATGTGSSTAPTKCSRPSGASAAM